jgi:hypothetical protein
MVVLLWYFFLTRPQTNAEVAQKRAKREHDEALRKASEESSTKLKQAEERWQAKLDVSVLNSSVLGINSVGR